MPAMTECRSLDEVSQRVELDRVVFYETRGRRRDGGLRDMPAPEDSDESGSTHRSQLHLMVIDEEAALGVRTQAQMSSTNVVIDIDVGAVFTKLEHFSMTDEVRQAFIHGVGLPLLIPYLRQAIDDVSTRLGHRITVGIKPEVR